MTAGAVQSQSGDIDGQAVQIHRLEARIQELESVIASAPVEVDPAQISLGRLLQAKDETIAAQRELIEQHKPLREPWKRKYHENWCTILGVMNVGLHNII